MIEIVKDSIDIAASASDVFAVASDVAAYPEWNANIKKADVLDHDEAGRATKVRMEVDAVIRTMTYTLDYDYSGAPRSFSWVLVEGSSKSSRGHTHSKSPPTQRQCRTRYDWIPDSSSPSRCAGRPKGTLRAPHWRT
jgi:hypothetical protein